MKKTMRLGWLAVALVLGACQAQQAAQPGARTPTASTEPAPSEAAPTREPPPASAPARAVPFPKIEHDELASGLRLDVVATHAVPVVQLRVVVKTGSASDGDLTGLANLTAQLIKAGGAGRVSSRDLQSRLEGMGAALGVDVGPDTTTFSLAVTRSHFDEAMDLLGSLAREPRWDGSEFNRLKKRQTERSADRAKSNGMWAATMLLWRELYRLPTGMHPYGPYDAMASEVGRIKLGDCQGFYKKNYSPKNSVVIVAGDVDLETSKRALDRAFGAWRGPEPDPPSFGEATAPEQPRILLADRPKSPQSEVYVAVLGPERREDAWLDAKVVNQVLGGSATSRLSADVREKRSLASAARSSLGELARGPVPLAAYAAPQTAKTGLALEAILTHLRRLASEPVPPDELGAAQRYLTDVFSMKMDTLGSVADLVVALEAYGLPDDYYDKYRQGLGQVTPQSVQEAAAEAFREGHWVIAVAGDAERIGPVLSHFGDVLVFNPEKEFEKVRTIPSNPSAPLEPPAAAPLAPPTP